MKLLEYTCAELDVPESPVYASPVRIPPMASTAARRGGPGGGGGVDHHRRGGRRGRRGRGLRGVFVCLNVLVLLPLFRTAFFCSCA